MHHDQRYQDYLNHCARNCEVPMPHDEWRETFNSWLDEEIRQGTEARKTLWDVIYPAQREGGDS